MRDAEPSTTVGRSREPIRFLVFSASLRRDSLNTRLARLAATTIEANEGEVDRASMRDFDTPSYDADVQEREGIPAGAKEFRRRLQLCDGFVIPSPEYDSSMPGLLKNVIDWTSRVHPQPFNERYGLLLSASPSMVGGNRGLWALRIPFEHLGARIYPDMFSLAQAHKAFDDSGRIADQQLQNRFDDNIVNFMDAVEANRQVSEITTTRAGEVRMPAALRNEVSAPPGRMPCRRTRPSRRGRTLLRIGGAGARPASALTPSRLPRRGITPFG